MKVWIFTILVSLVFISCSQRASNPEGILREFVEMRFSSNQNMSKMISYTTGDFRESLEKMTEEDIKAFVNHGLKNKNLEISHSKCTESTCSITYILSFDEYDENTLQNRSELKKIAKLVLQPDGWKISDVTNIKTFHDLKEPIQVTPE